MNSIHLQQTLPQVFADRNSVTSDVWHQDLIFRKGEMYLIEAASGTGKSSLCSYLYGYRNDYQGIINFDETNIKAYSVKQWVDLRKHSLSMLFQDLRIFTELTALENVQLKNNLTGHKKKKEIQEQKNKQEENRIKIAQEIENLTKELQDKEEEKRDLDSQISMIKGQLLLLENNNEQISAQVNKIKTDLLNTQNQDKNQIITKYKTEIPIEKINSIIESNNLHSLEEQLNTNKIKLTGLEIEENTILPQLDNLVNLEERLEADRQKKTELLQKEEVINLAIENLNKAYEEMKTTITPKFTNTLSEGIKEITNNKYEKVAINDENGMIIENARGEYIEANKLSTGTIDQLYLALRLSMIKDLSKETLPIILDETFAYFDNARLEKIIQYLNEKAKEHQTIIFTCTNREKEILDNLKIEYNYIEL